MQKKFLTFISLSIWVVSVVEANMTKVLGTGLMGKL